MNKLVIVIIIIAGFWFPKEERKGRYTELIHESLPKIVLVRAQVTQTMEFFGMEVTQEVNILGSGVLVSSKGHILTAAHLFDFDTVHDTTVEFYGMTGSTYSVVVSSVNHSKDLALLRVSSHTPTYAHLALPSKTVLGEEVLAIGHPHGLEWTVTNGIVSRLFASEGRLYASLVQTNASINPGNSGGALLNLDGELVGINSFIVSSVPESNGLGVAIDTRTILEFVLDCMVDSK